MASDTSLVFNLIARERVSQALERVKEKFSTAGNVASKAFAGLSAGLAPAGAAAVALGGVAASFASAGAAAGAFKAAVVPQLEDVTSAADLYAKVQETANEGGKKAAEAVKEYKEALAGMPPATRQTAVAFVGLKNDFDKWSDSLSGTTMPIFTKGIGILRGLLPTLTPFVHAAAGAIGDFLDRVAVGVKSAGFKEWAADMSQAAGPALSNLLTIVMNLAIGIGGLVRALLPANTGMTDLTGGMVGASEAFARWGAGLSQSEGFARFVDLAQDGGAAVGTFAGAVLHLLIAISPLLGTTALLATLLANVIAAIPTPALTVLAGLLGAITIGLKLWALYQTAATAATKVATAAQWLWNTALAANPITLIIIGVVALVAAIVILWKKNEAFRNFFKAAWRVILGAVQGVWNWTKRNWPLILGILTGPIGWATLAIVKNWDRIKGAGKRVFDWIADIPGRIARGFSRIGDILFAPFRYGFNLIASGWNRTIGRLQITVPSWVPGLGGASWGMPDIPYLAKGGRILAPGLAMVGEAGPEIVHLPAGATVAPLGRGGGVGVVRVVIDVRGADREMTRLIRKIVRVDGRGSTQTAFGSR